MGSLDDVSNPTLTNTLKFPQHVNVASGIANLIEAAETLRRNKIDCQAVSCPNVGQAERNTTPIFS